jgi:rare lipoprotein A
VIPGAWRAACALAIAMALVGCSQQPVRKAPPEPEPVAGKRKPPRPVAAAPADSGGGLYAPHIKDSGPATVPDISGIPEPVPVVEPLARYGNRPSYTVLGRTYQVMEDGSGYHERGVASWYGNKFHGRPTSSFEPYDMYKFTAAHRTLPLPSYVQVTNLDNGKSVVVRVNDRGPFHGDRLIDLSYVAAVKLDLHHRGTAPVEVRVLTPADSGTRLAAAPGTGLGPVGAGLSAGAARPVPARAFLQVASFSQHDNAERMQRQLVNAGLRNVDLQRADVDGNTVWRVRVGPYGRASNLERARDKIRGLGLGEPQTVAH